MARLQWYEVQDLVVTDILPQMVALSETYFQVGHACMQAAMRACMHACKQPCGHAGAHASRHAANACMHGSLCTGV